MTEERLKKIKQDIEVMDTYGGYKDRYLELYNEVIRLKEENEKIRKQNLYEHKYGNDMEGKYIVEKAKNDKAIEYIENNEVCCIEYIGRNEITGNLEKEIQRDLVNRTDLLNILKENNGNN